jgi:IS30 family transposase
MKGSALAKSTPSTKEEYRVYEELLKEHGADLEDLVVYVEYHLTHDLWSPESIAGRLSLDFPELNTNYESIYLWIYTERPPGVEMRAQAGHWEVDTVISRESKACVAVLVERKSRFFLGKGEHRKPQRDTAKIFSQEVQLVPGKDRVCNKNSVQLRGFYQYIWS